MADEIINIEVDETTTEVVEIHVDVNAAQQAIDAAALAQSILDQILDIVTGSDFNPSEYDLEEFLNAGFDPFAHQSEIPGPQNFQSVTDGAGNNETTNSIKVGGFEIKDKLAFIISSLTALRNINWQDKDGTVALLSDLIAIQEGIAWKQPAELLLQYADVVQGAGLPRIPGLTIQGHTLAQGSRVVVTGYNIPYQNGIFRVGSGPTIGTGEYSLSRVADANTSAELNNAVIGITNGTFAGKTYRQTTVNPVINTSPISFVEFGNSTVANATNVLAGIAKLYNAIGNEIDGAITPKAVKDGLDLKADLSSGIHLASQSRSSNLTYNSTTGVVTLTDARGDTHAIDLPIENLFQNASYNSTTQKLSLTTNGGGTIEVDLATLLDLPEIVVSASSNPVTTPSIGQRLYFRVDTGGYWIASGGVWNGPFLGVTASEKSIWNAKKDTAIITSSHVQITLADSTSYFFGINVGFGPTTSTNLARRFEAPFTGNIIDFYVKCISQTVTSSEYVVLKINNKTTGLSYTVGNVRYNNVVYSYIFNGFTIPVTKNDSLEFELVVPVLANNGLNSLTIASAVFEKS